MTKWVTLLLLLLALLAYGLSQMRPVPNQAGVESGSTPIPVAAETPSETTEVETPPETPTEPTQVSVSNPTTTATPKSPTFGLPAKAPEPTPSPEMAANTPKKDPFAPKTEKPKRPNVKGTIKATILSNSVDGPARSKFPGNTESIYLTATPEGLHEKVEVVARYRSILDADAKFSEPIVSSGVPRKRVFRLTAPADGWRPGPYQVTLTVKGTDQSLGLERFEILKPDAPAAQILPEPLYMDLVPNLEAEEAQMSYSKSDRSISLRICSDGIPKGTMIRSVWSAVEVDRLTAGELISVSTQPAPGDGLDALTTFEAPPGGFHTGSYKVDVYLDQQPVGSQMFFVQPPDKSNRNK